MAMVVSIRPCPEPSEMDYKVQIGDCQILATVAESDIDAQVYRPKIAFIGIDIVRDSKKLKKDCPVLSVDNVIELQPIVERKLIKVNKKMLKSDLKRCGLEELASALLGLRFLDLPKPHSSWLGVPNGITWKWMRISSRGLGSRHFLHLRSGRRFLINEMERLVLAVLNAGCFFP